MALIRSGAGLLDVVSRGEYEFLAEYLNEASLESDLEKISKLIDKPVLFDQNGVNVLSIHKSKGLQADYVFIVGNNPFASGSSYDAEGRLVFDELLPQSVRDKVYSLSELEQNTYFRDYVVKFIKENPSKFANLFFRKIFYFWWFAPQAGVLYSKLYLTIYKVYYLFIVVFAIIGLASLLRREREVVAIIILFFAAITLSHALSYIEIRHRWGIEPLVLIFTASGLIYTKERIGKSSY